MTKEEREKIFKQALEKWGEPAQLIVACEELAELIQAITKHLRHNDGTSVSYNLVEECADAQLVIDQILYMFDIGGPFEDIYKQKMNRLKKTIQDG